MSEIIEPCPHCGAECYDRVVMDAERDMPICPSCQKCVGMDCPCDEAVAMRESAK